jgi:23S rRNA pseudouridine1911/1915/1917 synthase
LTDEHVEVPFEVRAEEHGSRADLFLSRRIKRMSRTLAANLIRTGHVRRGGARPGPIRRPSDRVFSGELVLLERKKLNEAPTDDIELPIVHEDDAILAVNKPGDLVVHPTASAYHRTAIRVLRTRRPGSFLDLAHRIDKETSGLLILSKQPAVDAKLKDMFALRRVKKSYLAIVSGSPPDRFVVDAPMRLVPESDSGVRMEVGGEGATAAETEILRLASSPKTGASLVEARPRTGRQHQIRLHLAHAGHPIIGDKLYLGGEAVFLRSIREQPTKEELASLVGHWRHALHAWRAAFAHPTSGGPATLVAPLAVDLVALAVQLSIPLPDLDALAATPLDL